MRGIAVTNVIIIGANESGSRLVKDLSKYPQLGYKVVGFIDDDGRKEGSVREYRVWGFIPIYPQL